MNTYKEGWKLLKAEYKLSPPSMWSVLFMLMLSAFLAALVINGVDDHATLGTDILILVIVAGFPYVIQSDQIKAKNVGLRERISPAIIFFSSMPIARKSIATYRMISYVLNVIVFNSLFFTLFYLFSPYIRSIASVKTFIVFAIMLIGISIYLGGFQVVMEAGYHHLTTMFLTFLIWMPLILISVALLFHATYTKGMVQWMLDLSEAYPFIVVSLSILLSIIGFYFYRYLFVRKLQKIDY